MSLADLPGDFGFLTPFILHFVEGGLTFLRKWVDQKWAGWDKTAFGDDAYVTKKAHRAQAAQLKRALEDMDHHRNDAFELRKQLEEAQTNYATSKEGAENLQNDLRCC